jgi:L-amino acid N-acyltransferase YncA
LDVRIMSVVIVRDADPRVDAPACAAIYAPYVTDTVISFEEVAPSPAQIAERMGAAHVWLVAEVDGAVVGYAYGSPHRERPAYRWAGDVAIYLSGADQGRGTGRRLYAGLIERLRTAGLWTLCAGVAQPNDASNGLHEALGFEPVGTYRRIGWKNGAWHDVRWYQLDLRPGDHTPPH